MPPKKRTAPAATARPATKRKHASKATPNPDITARNSTSSPLLRLPAELRKLIWDYAYSNVMVTVHAMPRLASSDEEPEFVPGYRFYNRIITGQSMQDAQEDVRSRPPSPACRQFWAETSRAFLDTCTLRISCPNAMEALASTKYAMVFRVRKLIIVYETSESLVIARNAIRSLSYYNVGRFKNLEGVEIHLCLDDFRDWECACYMGDWEATDRMDDDDWQSGKLGHIVRVFQQHKLKHSSFVIHLNYGPVPTDPFYAWLAKLNETLCKELLNHRPLRSSRRGRGEDGGS